VRQAGTSAGALLAGAGALAAIPTRAAEKTRVTLRARHQRAVKRGNMALREFQKSVRN
jgi:hypothetical protein